MSEEMTEQTFDWDAATAEQRDVEVATRIMGDTLKWCIVSNFSDGIPYCECGLFDNRVRALQACADDNAWHRENGTTADAVVVPVAPHEYTTDAAADYRVLEHVRETWDVDGVCKFRDVLKSIWDERAMAMYSGVPNARGVWGPNQYQPGDYSRAALATPRTPLAVEDPQP